MPTGKHQPALDVRYEISHQLCETKDSYGLTLTQKKSVVHFISNDNGQHIPLGDFDLVVGSEVVRLKHTASDPEWLVLSSNK